MANKPILCVDFDGVIHSYTSGWQGATIIPDPPVKGALWWLWKATEWWDVNIFSSRSAQPGGVAAMQSWLHAHASHEWADMEFADQFLSAMKFPATKPAAFLTIDDRAVCFEGDWAALDPYELTQFKPWNKR